MNTHTQDMTSATADWLLRLHQHVQSGFHRAAVVLSGDKDWGMSTVNSLLHHRLAHSVLRVSSTLDHALSPAKARSQLGNEYDIIVFDAHDHLDVDALGAISGTLRGGGLLFVLIPQQADWKILDSSRFHQRAWPWLQQHAGVYFLQQQAALPALHIEQGVRPQPTAVPLPFRTTDQQQVVNAITDNVLSGHAVPLVLIADRGRGKSSALGLAAGMLLRQGIKNILVTAPRLSTSDPLFEHAQRVCPQGMAARGVLATDQGRLKFMAPDALLLERPAADLLLVDEAAAIPLSLLEAFLQHYPVIVFASTVHGYEGTGRGFTLKFNKLLDACRPGWRQLGMHQPIRWGEQDPLEQWIDTLLCLNADLADVAQLENIQPDQCSIQLMDRDALIRDEARLSSLFALLVNAHYRTQPSDLVHLLDDADVRIYCLIHQQTILGAALINQEGGYDQALSSDIYQGLRRPAGNLLPQTLTFHAGCEQAATINYARIMRIAIHPVLQGQGLGSYLLQQVTVREADLVDAIGSSFGATPALLRFWQTAGFELVRMGFTRDHASGTHSAVMLRPLNEKGDIIFKDVRQRFRHYVSAWLSDPLQDLPLDMKNLLQQEQQQDTADLTASDWKEIRSFAHTHRGYETVMWPVKKLIHHHAAAVKLLSEKEQQVIEARVIQNRSWSETVKHIQASGVAEAVQCLRRAVDGLLIATSRPSA